ncbi:MAG: hypothetical protein JRE47_12620 [Deltaproteobacteria bacterium]|nr:hypothetical protein [Deltaproteobacteria bacterium]
MKASFDKLRKIIVKPEWGFLSFALACFMFFGLSGNNLWKFLMNFEWIIDASKWSLIGGAFIFGVSAHTKTKQLSVDISKSIAQIKSDFSELKKNAKTTNGKQDHTFHLPKWLTGSDLIKTFKISEDQLKQYVLDGLLAYDVDDSVYWGAAIKKPLIIKTEFPWFEDRILELRFKKVDIEKYITNNNT